jgi:hypothetical protein
MPMRSSNGPIIAMRLITMPSSMPITTFASIERLSHSWTSVYHQGTFGGVFAKLSIEAR